MNLEKIDIKEFKKIIYPEYKKIFPRVERKPYTEIKRAYNNKIAEIIQIIEEEQIVGFIITNSLENNPYLQLDYFAVFPEYQGKGYGTQAIKLLKETYKNYDGIFIEIESIEHSKTEEEREIRQRRAKFYEKLGFCKMNFDVELFTVIYSAYMLPCKKDKFVDKEVTKNIFQIYTAICGEKRTKRNCKVLEKKG